MLHPLVQINLLQETAILAIQPVSGYAAVSIGSKIILYQYDETANLLRPIVEYEGKMLNTCIASMRGFMVCGDYLRGLSFIRFKETERDEPKRRIIELMAEDNTLDCVTATEFWVDNSHGTSSAFIGAIAANTKGFVQILVYLIKRKVCPIIVERKLEVAAEVYLGETVCKFIRIEVDKSENAESKTTRNCILYCNSSIKYSHL